MSLKHTPASVQKDSNMSVIIDGENSSVITIHCDSTRKIEAVLKLLIYDGVNRDRKISLKVIVYGKAEQDIQTMWNAVDEWVKHCSNFRSLIELYGHFTEPHPIFKVLSFDRRTELPTFKFAEHCMDFKNCSVYFPKEQLMEMWKESFEKRSFIELAKLLRSYRFDVRCHETNIAIPQGIYMVTYPFSLPYDKQMNFFVKE